MSVDRLPGWPLMLSEETAAAFLSVPVAAFQRAVARGTLPPARLVAEKRRWSRLDLERALHADVEIRSEDGEDLLFHAIRNWSAA
jgi:hypothetical protein